MRTLESPVPQCCARGRPGSSSDTCLRIDAYRADADRVQVVPRGHVVLSLLCSVALNAFGYSSCVQIQERFSIWSKIAQGHTSVRFEQSSKIRLYLHGLGLQDRASPAYFIRLLSVVQASSSGREDG